MKGESKDFTGVSMTSAEANASKCDPVPIDVDLAFESEGFLTQLKKIRNLQFDDLEHLGCMLDDIEVILFGTATKKQDPEKGHGSESEYIDTVRSLGDNAVSIVSIKNRVERIRQNLLG
jgi:hypothetical protein